jgi:hypothetical protein
MRGSVSSHHDYSKRMPLSFIKEIQSSYYKNMLVSIEGACLSRSTQQVQCTPATLETGQTPPIKMPLQ